MESFLTEVAEDWTEGNLIALQEAIREAEAATLARSNPEDDPLLASPNLPNFRGTMRWLLVQKCLEAAVNNGRFSGITANWVNLGGVHSFELHGRYTSVTAYHLLTEDDAPRESTLRRSQRITNQICPLLRGFEALEPASPDELLHLLLVHGGKDGEFAYLRAYYDPYNRSAYRLLSRNIMLMPTLLPSIEVEPIAEPEIGLKDSTSKKAASE